MTTEVQVRAERARKARKKKAMHQGSQARPKVAEHDYDCQHARQFLEKRQGEVTVTFRRRWHQELGHQMLQR
jgi:translation initiation factor IF-3